MKIKSVNFQNRIWNFISNFDNLPFLIGIGSIIGLMNLFPIIPNDYWFHIFYGREILTTGKIPWVDRTSFTMAGSTYDSVGVYWLGEVTMEIFHRFLGSWETFAYAIILALTYVIIGKTNLLRSKNVYASGWALILTIIVSFTNWNIRPQIFAFFYFSIIFYFFTSYNISTTDRVSKIDLRSWAIILLTLLLWQNTHGTYIFGYFLIFVLVIFKYPLRDKIYISLLLILFSFITPLGPANILYFAKMFGSNMASREITEWLPATIHELNGQVFFPFLFIVLLISIKKPKINYLEMFINLCFLILALKYRRAIILFGIVSSPYISLCLREFSFFTKPRSSNARTARMNRTISFLFLVLILMSLPPIKIHLPLPDERKDFYSLNTPIDQIVVLEDKLPTGNVFTHVSYASLIPYQTNANYRIFMDARIELYSDEVFSDYLTINFANPGWESVSAKYPIDHWLLSKEDQPNLIDALKESDTIHTRLVYEDEDYIIFTNIE